MTINDKATLLLIAVAKEAGLVAAIEQMLAHYVADDVQSHLFNSLDEIANIAPITLDLLADLGKATRTQ